MSTDCDVVIIGAGVVGLAIAKVLAEAGRDVLLLEQEASFGTVTSARNSEVIHAGIYYAAYSLKARLCVAGRQALYRYCQERHINHDRCGKLIVATNASQVCELASIKARAMRNGVDDIASLSADEANGMEPQLDCLAALHSPSTGIIDSHGLMLALLGDAENQGAVLASRSPVLSIERNDVDSSYLVNVGGENGMLLTARRVINASGHGAIAIANSVPSLSPEQVPEAILSKGNYFRLSGKAPFSRLIYPVPEPGGLGVHITIDLAGQARFGPDVQPIMAEEYSVDASRSESFYAAIRRYWPGLPDNSLMPDYAGIRPKIRYRNELYNDFLIQSEKDHGLPGLINLFGIESPGLTASLAIAEHVHAVMGR